MLRSKVYVFGISFATASCLRFGAMTTTVANERKTVGEGDLTVETTGVQASHLSSTAAGWGNPRVGPPFIVCRRPIISRLMRVFTFLPSRTNLSMVISVGAPRVFLPGKSGVGRLWEFRSPFSPSEELFVSSAHLRGGTALTDEGLLLGNMVFGTSSHDRRESSTSCHVYEAVKCAK
jgi:hypothetical protein